MTCNLLCKSSSWATGHAVMMCRPLLAEHRGPVLVVAGDSPLMQPASLQALLADFERQPAACILGTGYKDDPTGLGRVVRDAERKFSGDRRRKRCLSRRKVDPREVNLSCYVFDCQALLSALEQIRSDNSQREYYLTDCPGVLKSEGKEVRALDVLQPCETLSINTMHEARGRRGDHEIAKPRALSQRSGPAKSASGRPKPTGGGGGPER